jgi:ribosome-associated toxin RatA of RatAB toxin-antitoxin module
MPRVQRSVYVHYSAEQMFDLVEDVESYPQFLPWCAGTRIVADHEGGVDASIDIAYKGFSIPIPVSYLIKYV